MLVTPGISPGEQQMKNECIACGYPLIHLQKEPIGDYWKPEKSRFEACVNGSLLILAPWQLDGESDYSRFHNMNDLAAALCAFTGEARLKG